MDIDYISERPTDIIKGRVTVLIPCYNAENYIKRCIDSVLAQTWRDIELILVNDGSTDNTDSIIESYRYDIEKRLSRFVYIKQENQGVGAAMNVALKYFTGEYLAPFDCDDYMMPKSLEIRASWLSCHLDTAVVQNNGYYVTEDNYNDVSQKFCAIQSIQENIPLFDWIIDGKTYNWAGSYMVRASKWLALFPAREIYPSRNGQNLQILLPVAYMNKCDYIPDCLMKYIRHSGSLSHTNPLFIEQKIKDILGYQDICKTVLKTVLPREKYKICGKRAEIAFARTILNLGVEIRNKAISKKYYKKLKNMGGITLEDRINYYRIINIILFYMLRLYRKFISYL